MTPAEPTDPRDTEIERLRVELAEAEREASTLRARIETAEAHVLDETWQKSALLADLARVTVERDESRTECISLRGAREVAERRATDATEVVREAHSESGRLRGYAAGWLYIVEDSLKKDAAGQTFGLRLLRDQMRRALAGQQALIKEARNHKETTMETNEIVTPNPAHCPTCGGPGSAAMPACLPCGGTGSARACAEFYTEATYDLKAILTNFHILALKWEQEVASRQRPLTASAEMMKHCAAEIRHTLPKAEEPKPEILGGGRHG